MLESTRAKEAEVRKETTQQLDIFRKQQEEAEKATTYQGPAESPETEPWKTGSRKRKKGRETGIGGLKLRKTSTSEGKADATTQDAPKSPKPAETYDRPASVENTPAPAEFQDPDDSTSKSQSPPAATGLGLAVYSSDEDD